MFLRTCEAGENSAEIKHRMSQTRTAVNALISIWWQKNIAKIKKLYIYQTIIKSILVYDAEILQIPTGDINKILSTKMDVIRKSEEYQGWKA